MALQVFMNEKKNTLRKILKQRRLELNDREIENLSQKITENFVNTISFKNIRTFYLYRSIRSKKEVDTSYLISWLSKNYPNIKIEFAPNKKPFLVPKGHSYDILIVPVLGFDKSGNRLGYGGGYYDRLLSLSDCKRTIGLAYSFCEVERLPVEDHDKKLDMVITEDHVISF